MAKVSINGLLLLRRAYTVAAAENVRVQAAALAKRKVSLGKQIPGGLKEEVFWMRHPKTGNWIPESHFEEVDVAELRAKLLSKKEKL